MYHHRHNLREFSYQHFKLDSFQVYVNDPIASAIPLLVSH